MALRVLTLEPLLLGVLLDLMRKLFVYSVLFLVLLSVKSRICFINLYDLCKLILLPNNNFNNNTYLKKGVNSYEEI